MLWETVHFKIFQCVEQRVRNVNRYGPFFDLDLTTCYTGRRFIRAVRPINVGVKYGAELFILSIGFNDTELRLITRGDAFMLTDLLSSQDIFNTPDLKTKMSILHAVDRSLDCMTISEICEKANISRQTFYRHFRSKYDIPWWFCIFCRQFYLNEIGRTMSWRTGYYHHIRLLSTEREFFRKSIQYSINTPFGQTVMPQNRESVLLETLKTYRNVPVDHNMQFLVEMFSKLECEVLNDWFRSDADTDLVVWTDDLVSLVPDRLYRALDISQNV